MNLTFFIIGFIVSPSLQATRPIENGITCYSSNGAQGTCKRRETCKTELDNDLKMCNTVENHPLVCCPPERNETILMAPNGRQDEPDNSISAASLPNKANNTNIRKSSEIARQKCAEYAESVKVEIGSPALKDDTKITVDLCARVEQPLVVGGEVTKPREYPHMALIGYYENPIEWFCGGSLISENFVLSAAHCSKPSGLGPATWVRLGEYNTSTTEDEAEPIDLRIIERIDHPDYNSVTFYNDISLFRLEKSVKFNAFIRPICLNILDTIPYAEAIATGWGHTVVSYEIKRKKYIKPVDPTTSFDIRTAYDQQRNPSSPVLMKVKLNLVDNKECNMKYRSSIGKEIPKGILDESMICAGDEIGMDTCKGDSGGPLQVPIENPYCMYDMIGLTSFGKECGSIYPGIYTRISYFLPWIVQNVWPEKKVLHNLPTE